MGSPDEPPPPSSTTATALTRLTQLSSHLPTAPPLSSSPAAHRKPRRRIPSNPKPSLPADYSDILSTLNHLRTLATTPNPENAGYARQRAAGKLWVRERVRKCFDEGSVREIGSVSGSVEWKTNEKGEEEAVGFTPSNNVGG